MNDLDSIKNVFLINCADHVRVRKECWERSLEGKGGEDCIREELQEKRCLATNFCPKTAHRFYELDNGECSKWAEAFAFGPNEAQREVNESQRKKNNCRQVVMTLSKCMSKFREYNPNFEPHKDDPR